MAGITSKIKERTFTWQKDWLLRLTKQRVETHSASISTRGRRRVIDTTHATHSYDTDHCGYKTYVICSLIARADI